MEQMQTRNVKDRFTIKDPRVKNFVHFAWIYICSGYFIPNEMMYGIFEIYCILSRDDDAAAFVNNQEEFDDALTNYYGHIIFGSSRYVLRKELTPLNIHGCKWIFPRAEILCISDKDIFICNDTKFIGEISIFTYTRGALFKVYGDKESCFNVKKIISRGCASIFDCNGRANIKVDSINTIGTRPIINAI